MRIAERLIRKAPNWVKPILMALGVIARRMLPADIVNVLLSDGERIARTEDPLEQMLRTLCRADERQKPHGCFHTGNLQESGTVPTKNEM